MRSKIKTLNSQVLKMTKKEYASFVFEIRDDIINLFDIKNEYTKKILLFELIYGNDEKTLWEIVDGLINKGVLKSTYFDEQLEQEVYW